MATVRRYSRSARVLTEPQADIVETQPSGLFSAVRQGLDSVVAFLRPAVEEEQTQKGAGQALDDIRAGRYQKKRPYSIRSQAYNAAAERVIGAKVRTAYSQGVGEAIRGARSEEDLQNRLNDLVNQSMGDLGPQFNSMRVGLEAQTAAMFELAKGRFARPDGVVARDRRGAADALSAAAATVGAATQGEFAPEAAETLTGQALDALVAHGPPHAFRIGNREYPADPKRPGNLSVQQLGAFADQAAADMRGAAARKTAAEADVLAPLIADLDRERPGLPPDVRDEMRRAAVTEQRRRNREKQGAEQAAMRAFARAATRPIPPDVPSPPQLPPDARRSERAGRRQFEIEPEFLAMGQDVARSALDGRLAVLAPAADAEAVEDVQLYLQRISELAADGRIADDPESLGEPPQAAGFAHGRKQWGERAANLFATLREHPPATVEEIEDLEAAAAALAADGQRHGREAGVADLTERRALERVGATLEERGKLPPVEFARATGSEIGQIDASTPATAAETLAARAAEMDAARDLAGIEGGADILPAEATALAEMLVGSPMPERVAFLDAIGRMPMGQRRRITSALRDVSPGLAAAVTAAGIASTPTAARLLDGVQTVPVDRGFIADVAGEETADIAADLAAAGVPEPEVAAVAAVDPAAGRALRDRVAPEDVDTDLSPAAQRHLSRRAPRSFETDLDDADRLTTRISADPDMQRLASAANFIPDRPEAVAGFSRMVEQFEATAPEERDAFVEEVRTKRARSALSSMPRPLYYSGDTITLEGLKEAAGRIVRRRRDGAIDEATYFAQADLIRRMVEELE